MGYAVFLFAGLAFCRTFTLEDVKRYAKDGEAERGDIRAICDSK